MAARKTLAERAELVTQLTRGRDLEALPKGILKQIELFERALGLTPSAFLSYSKRTRQRYVGAARKGRTAKQQREYENELKRARVARKRAGMPATTVQGDPRWKRVQHLKRELVIEGMIVLKGSDTQTDRLDFIDLYSDDSLVSHITVYGYPYVLDRLEHQFRAIRQYNTSGGKSRSIGRKGMEAKFGTTNRRDFAASPKAFYNEDERWYWYHATHYYYGNDPTGPKLIGM